MSATGSRGWSGAPKRVIKDLLAKTGALPIAMTSYSRLQRTHPRLAISNRTLRQKGAPDGLPLPPTKLVELVAGTPDLAWFLKGGALAASCVREALAAQGEEMEDLTAILDFGSGCGRVARHWAGLKRVKVHGVDYNPELIAWSQDNLRFAEFSINRPMPPLQFQSAQFDAIYAFSVFTHMTDVMQDRWMQELRRVLRPGGYLIFSTHGDNYKHHLSASERAAFEAGERVVKPGGPVGTNMFQAYHPRCYVEKHLCHDLEPVAFTPAGALGNPVQDLHVFRRPLEPLRTK